MKLEGKVAIVTGGGSGQGRSTAQLFAREGAAVGVADWHKDQAEEVAETIRSLGGRALPLHVDVSRETDVLGMVKTVREHFGRLDILFNNAGIGFSAGDRFTMASVVDTPEEDWDAILAINLKGVALGCKHAIPVMVKQGGGVIVNNASINALVAMPGADAYTAAKGGIVALTRVLANDWGPKGIRVNCICPGGVDTPMVAPVLKDPQVLAAMKGNCPLGRIADPEEIAKVALFLASEDSSYVNGVILPVDGGWTAR